MHMTRKLSFVLALLLSLPVAAEACCKICSSTSKACGDGCISRNFTCHQPVGCACDGGGGSPPPQPTLRPTSTPKPSSPKPKFTRTSRSIDATVQMLETSGILCAHLAERKGAFWRPGRILSDGKFLPLSVEIKNVKYLMNFYPQPKRETYQRLLDKLTTQFKKRKKVCTGISPS